MPTQTRLQEVFFDLCDLADKNQGRIKGFQEFDTMAEFVEEQKTKLQEAEAMTDTFADMLDALYIALPFVEDHEQSDIYKTGAVTKALTIIRAAIKQAENL